MKQYKPTKTEYGRRVFIGVSEGEEMFLMPVKWDCDWYWGGIYLEGVRPYTEEELRQNMRDHAPEDYGIVLEGTARNYFDEDRWRADLEEEWYDAGDVTEEQERNGVTYYLCFGTQTHVDSYLMAECGGTYATAKKKFDKLCITESQFNELMQIATEYYRLRNMADSAHNVDESKYLKLCADIEKLLSRYEALTHMLHPLPTEEEWLDREGE